jgi:methyl-accepting chemotaxis protein
MKNGEMSSEESDETFLFDGQKSYVFFTPVKYTDWVIITIVPTQHIEMLGYFVGLALLAIIALAMLIIVMVGYYYVKNGIEPLKGLAMMADGIAKGRFDAPMPDIKHDDELAYLRDSLEKMQYTLSNRQEK